jgi:hypothetical protein
MYSATSLLAGECLTTNESLRPVLLITPLHVPHRKQLQTVLLLYHIAIVPRTEHRFQVAPLLRDMNLLPNKGFVCSAVP